MYPSEKSKDVAVFSYRKKYYLNLGLGGAGQFPQIYGQYP
jgi:hypothetical protein